MLQDLGFCPSSRESAPLWQAAFRQIKFPPRNDAQVVASSCLFKEGFVLRGIFKLVDRWDFDYERWDYL
jgi:hypothetical protein